MSHIELVQKRTDQLKPGEVVRVDREFTAWEEDDDRARSFSATPYTSWGVVEEVYNIHTEYGDDPPVAEDFASGGATQPILNLAHSRPAMRIVHVDWPMETTVDYCPDRYIAVTVHDLWTVQQVKEN